MKQHVLAGLMGILLICGLVGCSVQHDEGADKAAASESTSKAASMKITTESTSRPIFTTKPTEPTTLRTPKIKENDRIRVRTVVWSDQRRDAVSANNS